MSATAHVSVLPKCDFCPLTASFDFKTWLGPWANGCTAHWQMYRAFPDLGTGKGQRLVVPFPGVIK
jgi:hypothetical protein